MNTVQIDIKQVSTGTLSNTDGLNLKIELCKVLSRNDAVVLSFAGVGAISSSFLNSSLGEIVDDFGIDTLKNKIRITNYTPTIAEFIRKYMKDLTLLKSS